MMKTVNKKGLDLICNIAWPQELTHFLQTKYIANVECEDELDMLKCVVC